MGMVRDVLGIEATDALCVEGSTLRKQKKGNFPMSGQKESSHDQSNPKNLNLGDQRRKSFKKEIISKIMTTKFEKSHREASIDAPSHTQPIGKTPDDSSSTNLKVP